MEFEMKWWVEVGEFFLTKEGRDKKQDLRFKTQDAKCTKPDF